MNTPLVGSRSAARLLGCKAQVSLTLLVRPADLKPLTDRIAQERKLMHSRTEELFPAAVDEWQQHFAAVLQVGMGVLIYQRYTSCDAY